MLTGDESSLGLGRSQEEVFLTDIFGPYVVMVLPSLWSGQVSSEFDSSIFTLKGSIVLVAS